MKGNGKCQGWAEVCNESISRKIIAGNKNLICKDKFLYKRIENEYFAKCNTEHIKSM